ncbi:hypothetical protein EV356DRAFT_535434 [Viridothelium virens]|uniref:Uncharacterized protein n=1 Tax=Viridothelium virens TaxID=1048519 RepID=A0A6A6H0A5_VIRVR|nr:hypothetical protein EV356DRAFT_535434 [Viridothelium virens]
MAGSSTPPPMPLTPSITIARTGAAASSSKSAIQAQPTGDVFPLVEGWIDNPRKDTDSIIKRLDGAEDSIQKALSDTSGGSGQDRKRGCRHSFLSLLSCIVSKLATVRGTIAGIRGTIADNIVSMVRRDLSDLKGLTTELESIEDDQLYGFVPSKLIHFRSFRFVQLNLIMHENHSHR